MYRDFEKWKTSCWSHCAEKAKFKNNVFVNAYNYHSQLCSNMLRTYLYKIGCIAITSSSRNEKPLEYRLPFRISPGVKNLMISRFVKNIIFISLCISYR